MPCKTYSSTKLDIHVFQRKTAISVGYRSVCCDLFRSCHRNSLLPSIGSLRKRNEQGIGPDCGAEHPSTLTGMANLASTYRNQGRWKEAEELDVQVMETRKRVLGE
jgi:hypothetical protein